MLSAALMAVPMFVKEKVLQAEFLLLHNLFVLGPIKGNPGPQNNARGQQRQNTVSNAINNVDANKPEAFQDLTQQAVNQDVGASSLEFETIKKPNKSGGNADVVVQRPQSKKNLEVRSERQEDKEG